MPPVLFSLCAVSLVVAALLRSHGLLHKGGAAGGLLLKAVPAVILCLLAGLIARSNLDTRIVQPSLAGLAAGSASTFLAAVLGELLAAPVVALSLGCAVSGFLLLQGKASLDPCALAAILGGGIFAALLDTRAATRASLVIAAVGFCHLLTNSKGAYPAEGLIAPLSVGAATILGVLGQLASKQKRIQSFWPVIASILTVLFTMAIARACFPETNDWMGLLAVPIGAALVYWMDADAPTQPKFNLGLSAVIWIGVATLAFGVGRSAGLGLALLVGVGLLVTLDRERPLLSASILIGLAMNRAIRMEHANIGSTLDLSQYYVLIGFALGTCLPLLAPEWFKKHLKLNPFAVSLSGTIWLAISLAAPTLVALFLAPKGLLGFVTGLGFCGFLIVGESGLELSPLVLASTAGSVAILEYGAVEKLGDLSRNEKIHWFMICSIALFIMAGALWALSSLRTFSSAQKEA